MLCEVLDRCQEKIWQKIWVELKRKDCYKGAGMGTFIIIY
jgi:hypothetical protein